MKKFIVLCLFGLLIMGFTTTAYAQIDFKAYGGLFFGGLLERNFSGGVGAITQVRAAPFMPSDPAVDPANSGAWDRQASFMTSYANIFFEWNAGKEVKGVFNIETCNYYAGTNTISRNTPPAIYQTIQGAEFDTGLWDSRLGQTRLRNAYVQFAVPYFGIPVPMTVTAGIIPMATRPQFMWATTEGTGIQVDFKADPAAFTFTWGKMAEGKTASADDSDFYSFEGRTNVGPATVGGYVIYNNMHTYPISYNANAYGVPNTNDAGLWWFGAYADAKMGPVNLNFDFGFDTGKIKGNPNVLGDVPAVKYRGWAGQLRITYPWEMFKVGVFGYYASGADLSETSTSGLPGTNVAEPTLAGVNSTKVGSWVFPAGDVQWVVWAESMFLGGDFSTLICIPQGWQGNVWNTQATRGSTGGTGVAKLFASAQAAPWYKVTVWGLYIGDTTKNGNTFGNAQKADGTLRNDKTIGWEFALIQDINIYKSLTLSIGAGYLFAGKALDQNIPGTTDNKSPKNPYILGTKLAYMF